MILWLRQVEIKHIAELFTKGSRHRNISVIYVVQNIFDQGRETRNISLNAHYILPFKSPRDKQHISVLARQVHPGHACSRIYEKLWGSDKASSWLSHAGFKTHNRWLTSIKNERTARRKYHWSTKPGPRYSKAIVSTTTHRQWPTSTEIERTAQRKHHWSTKPGPIYSNAIIWTISHPQRYVQLGSTDEANCTNTAPDTRWKEYPLL